MVLALGAGMTATSVAPAHAGKFHRGVGSRELPRASSDLAFLALQRRMPGRAITRAIDDEDADACYRGPRECHWAGPSLL